MPVRPARGGPSPLRWLVGVELARHREGAGLSMAQVAEMVGMTKAKIGHIETGRQLQSPADIASLLTAYQVDRDTIDRLVALTERADEAAWWTGAAQAVPEWFGTFAGLEHIATREFVFEPTVITGLLQTEAYSRAINSASLLVRAADVDRVVALRLARAERVVDVDDPLELHAVLAEPALRLRVGDAATRRAQLEHLVEMARRPNVTLQVVRPEDGYHDAHQGRLILLDFAEVRSIGYVEMVDGAVYLQDPDQVRTCTLIADQLSRIALDPDSSVELIDSLANDITN
jgi:transcriptional regulator with XRE-family HTH domain